MLACQEAGYCEGGAAESLRIGFWELGKARREIGDSRGDLLPAARAAHSSRPDSVPQISLRKWVPLKLP